MTFDEFKEAFLLVLAETTEVKEEEVSEDSEEELSDADIPGLEGESVQTVVVTCPLPCVAGVTPTSPYLLLPSGVHFHMFWSSPVVFHSQLFICQIEHFYQDISKFDCTFLPEKL